MLFNGHFNDEDKLEGKKSLMSNEIQTNEDLEYLSEK